MRAQLLFLLKDKLQSIQKEESFTPLFLPLSDTTLEKYCIELCQKQNLPWKDVNATSNEFIIHKHTLRDRTEVIAERNEQLQKAEIINYLSLLSRMYILFKPFTFLQKLAVCSFPQIVNSRNLLFNS